MPPTLALLCSRANCVKAIATSHYQPCLHSWMLLLRVSRFWAWSSVLLLVKFLLRAFVDFLASSSVAVRPETPWAVPDLRTSSLNLVVALCDWIDLEIMPSHCSTPCVAPKVSRCGLFGRLCCCSVACNNICKCCSVTIGHFRSFGRPTCQITFATRRVPHNLFSRASALLLFFQ